MLAYYLVTVVHVLVCVILILVVLLQSGKGADLAGAFGGGATQTAFGSRGPASILSKVTTVAAVVFMLTSISLSMMGSKTEAKSILDTTRGTQAAPPKAAPKAPPAAPAQSLSPEEIKKVQQEIEAKQKQAPASQPTQPQGAPPASGKKP